jgi:hypothetical protein
MSASIWRCKPVYKPQRRQEQEPARNKRFVWSRLVDSRRLAQSKPLDSKY